MRTFFLLIVLFFFSASVEGKDSIKVYLFLLDDCPICQSYAPKMNNLFQEYGQSFSFVGIFPNFSSKPHKIKAYKEKFGIHFPTKTDYYKSLVKRFDIKVTPEVIVLDESKDKILYKGRIDNEFVGLGKRRTVVTTDELKDVLEFLSQGNYKTFKFTEAIGCFINMNDPTK